MRAVAAAFHLSRAGRACRAAWLVLYSLRPLLRPVGTRVPSLPRVGGTARLPPVKYVNDAQQVIFVLLGLLLIAISVKVFFLDGRKKKP